MAANRSYGVLIGLGISLGLTACAHLGTGRSGQASPPAQPDSSAQSAAPPESATPPATGGASEPPAAATSSGSSQPSGASQPSATAQPSVTPQPAAPKSSKPPPHPPAAANRRPSPPAASGSSPKSSSTPQAGEAVAPKSPAPPAAAPKSESPPPAAAASTGAGQPASLDLNSLEQRLRDTHAIGVFTKLSLKNQVDDLLAAFRAFHNNQPGKTLAQLRQQYDVLLLKVLSLLQDGDPSLAAAISASREALWGILTDPQKFSKI